MISPASINRYGAFLIHLAISGVIFLVLVGIILFYWFPNGLIFAGGVEGLQLIIGVDLVLGPLLTLVVYSPGKKGLKLDLSMIATLQIVCLLIGIWLVHNQRPVFEVLLDDGVHLISYTDANENGLDFDGFSGSNPTKVMIELPDNPATWATVKLVSELADAKPFAFRSDLYLPLESVTAAQVQNRISYILEHFGSTELTALNAKRESSCVWIPVVSIHTNGYACFSYANGTEKLYNK